MISAQKRCRRIAEVLNQKYGEGSVEVKVTESYRNMREKIEPCMELVDMAVCCRLRMWGTGTGRRTDPWRAQTEQDSASWDFHARILERAVTHFTVCSSTLR